MNRTFVMQTDSGMPVENAILKDIFKSYEHQINLQGDILQEVSMSYFSDNIHKFVDAIPVGNLEFIALWLKENYKKNMTPVEVPECLRCEEFLLRKYNIIKKSDFSEPGYYFVKNASHLKQGSFMGTIMTPNDICIDDTNDLFVLSEEFLTKSEWRVYVINNRFFNIANYDGDPSLFPDMNKIRKMIFKYSINDPNRPKSYTMDIMVGPKNKENQNMRTAILEVHPFVSVGLYTSLWDLSLLDAYEQGIEYYKNF